MLTKLTRKMKGDKPKRFARKIISDKQAFIPNGQSIAKVLYDRDRRPEISRLHSEWFNVSALVNGVCPRAKHLAFRSGAKGIEVPRPADRLLWTIGKAVEAHIRQSLIDVHGAKTFLGTWTCRCGMTEHLGYGAEYPEHCTHCMGGTVNYSEYLLMNHEYLLTGSPDMIAKHGRKHTVIETKSIKVGGASGAPEFHSLEGPQRSHILQALMYRKLLELAEVEVTNEVVIAYGAKDYIMKNPYKVFEVDATEDLNEAAVEHLLGIAKQYAKDYHSKALPPRLPVCPNITSTRAKNCAVCADCFNKS